MAVQLKLERVLAGAGIVLLVVIVFAILNTYTDLFKDAFKEDKPATVVEEQPTLKAKPKEGMMDLGREGKGKAAQGGSQNQNQEEDTPAQKFVDDVHKEYPELLKVAAQFEQGGSCQAQLLLDAPTLEKWRGNQNRLVRALTGIREKAGTYSESQQCTVDVMLGEATVIRAAPQGNQTKVTLYKDPTKEET